MQFRTDYPYAGPEHVANADTVHSHNFYAGKGAVQGFGSVGVSVGTTIVALQGCQLDTSVDSSNGESKCVNARWLTVGVRPGDYTELRVC